VRAETHAANKTMISRKQNKENPAANTINLSICIAHAIIRQKLRGGAQREQTTCFLLTLTLKNGFE
jgi:hypothetical protein